MQSSSTQPPLLHPNITIAGFKEHFQNDPLYVIMDISREDSVDSNGLAIMPVPAMMGPFERLLRDFKVKLKEANPTPQQPQEPKKNVLEIQVEKGHRIDVGICFLKV
jgi:hypothetical protein